jgi:hypothetical protein
MMGRPYINVIRIPVYVVLQKIATGEAAARLVAAMKFVIALECFDFRWTRFRSALSSESIL